MTFGDLKCKIRLPRISFENNTDRSKCLHYFNSNKENTADKKRQLHTLHPRKVIKTKKNGTTAQSSSIDESRIMTDGSSRIYVSLFIEGTSSVGIVDTSLRKLSSGICG